MSMSSTDKGLLTPENCAVIFIDYQPQMLSVLSNQEQRDLLDNLQVLAKAAQMFGAPVILTVVESKDFSGKVISQLQDQFPDRIPFKRSSLNAWDDPQFVAAVRQTGRRNFLMAGLWSEACLAFAALQMLEEGFGIYVVKDASGGTNQAAHDTALRRVEQAGGVSLTALQVMLEFQRDWAKAEHSDEVMAIVKACCRGLSQGAELHVTMVGGVPVNRKSSASKGGPKRKEMGQ
jgi:nicotinamidase-related amidase